MGVAFIWATIGEVTHRAMKAYVEKVGGKKVKYRMLWLPVSSTCKHHPEIAAVQILPVWSSYDMPFGTTYLFWLPGLPVSIYIHWNRPVGDMSSFDPWVVVNLQLWSGKNNWLWTKGPPVFDWKRYMNKPARINLIDKMLLAIGNHSLSHFHG
jgi:hypothetical protein